MKIFKLLALCNLLLFTPVTIFTAEASAYSYDSYSQQYYGEYSHEDMSEQRFRLPWISIFSVSTALLMVLVGVIGVIAYFTGEPASAAALLSFSFLLFVSRLLGGF